MGRVLLHMVVVFCFGPKPQIAYSAMPRLSVLVADVGDRILDLLEGGAILEMIDLEVLNAKQLKITNGTASIHVLGGEVLKDSRRTIQTDASASMDQPPFLTQACEHRASERGAGWPQSLSEDNRILDWDLLMGG